MNADMQKTEAKAFDFSDVPTWYALCINHQCPLRDDCLRYLAGTNAPDTLDTAVCVMPKALKDGKCVAYDKKTVVVWAAGFSHLYDHVLKSDFTTMRKTITRYLHGVKFYYMYMRGERPLSPEQQAWLKNYVKSCGYEVEFDRYFEAYVYHNHKEANVL
jgi:hypothetical protein